MSSGRYSIKELEKLSGIKAHTIRIWEQRYKLLKPGRTATNIRYYTDDDLRKILNVSLLLNNGMKISAIASLSERAISKAVRESGSGKDPQFDITELIKATETLNEPEFEKAFSDAVLKFGIKSTFESVVYPFLNKVGLLWGSGDLVPAQEHFASQLIRQKLFTAINARRLNENSTKKFLLFLPEDEQHEIPLLFTNYLLRERGFHTLYLGPDVPLKNIAEINNIYKPTHLLFFFITRTAKNDITAYIQELKKFCNTKNILVCSSAEQLAGLKDKGNVRYLSDPGMLRKIT